MKKKFKFLTHISLPFSLLFSLLFSVTFLTGCLTNTAKGTNKKTAPATLDYFTAPTGPRIAQIIFNNTSTGSFNTASSAGTIPTPNSGHPVVRFWDGNGTQIIPNWIQSAEIGISGASNTAAVAPACARFTDGTTEISPATDCNAGPQAYNPAGIATTVACNAPDGIFRVSEADCTTANLGNGGPNDGVYVRINLNRNPSYLASHENLLLTLYYSAASFHSAPQNPNSCFSSGTYNPDDPNCADLSWKFFLKRSAEDITQPFMLFVPPFPAIASPVSSVTRRGSSGVASKQFILPIASDGALNVIQLSRIRGPNGNISTLCNSSTPHCAGVILYSMTIQRI